MNEDLPAYPFDLAKVDELMTAAGFAKNADGFWAKDGTELAPSIMVYYAQGIERYEILLSLVDQLSKAGFKAEPSTWNAPPPSKNWTNARSMTCSTSAPAPPTKARAISPT